MSSPYHHRTAIHNSRIFFGRTSPLSSMYSATFARQSISVVGSPRVGKTSLLKHMTLIETQQQFKIESSRYSFIFIDMNEYLNNTSESFFDSVGLLIAGQSKTGIDLSRLSQAGSDKFKDILTYIEKQGELHPVLIMDNFDSIKRIKEFTPAFFSFLRAQAEGGRITYITASIVPIEEICTDSSNESPFFNIFAPINLGPLEEKEARELVTKPSNEAGRPFTDSEIEWILSLAGNHPFFIQRLCDLLFEVKSLKMINEINLNELKTRAYDDLLPNFRHIWRYLTKTQQDELKNIVKHSGSFHKNMAELSTSLLFIEFVQQESHDKHIQITQEEMEKALENIGKPQELAESKLSNLKIVSARMKLFGSYESYSKAKAIRAVLSDALIHLKGHGMRSDRARDWMNYNILNYHYFDYHMTHKEVAAKLNFTSDRTYYRKRNQAIKALLDILLEMEAEFEDDPDNIHHI